MSRQSAQAVRGEGVPRSAAPGSGQETWIENRAPSGWFPRLDLGEEWASREIALVIRSPHQRLLDKEVLTFRLWPSPDERRVSVERNRIVQPAVEWRWEWPALARTARS